jgi:hypothetical protein
MEKSDERHHVVIIGGGFGGFYAAKSLKKKTVRIPRSPMFRWRRREASPDRVP